MIPKQDYSAHETLVALARPSASLWRLMGGFILVIVAYFALGRMYFQTASLFSDLSEAEFYTVVFLGLSPSMMFLVLGSFGCMTLAVWVVVRLVHNRTLGGLLGPLRLFTTQFITVSLFLLGLSVVLFVLPPWGMDAPYVANLPFDKWLLLLPFSLVAVFVQVSSEEILFRGYLQQQLAARFRSPLIWMLLPSALFAYGHYVPEGNSTDFLIPVWAGLFGLLMADITARAGSLGPAIALHLWNNMAALAVLSFPDNLSGLALYHLPFDSSDVEQMLAWLPVDFVLMLVAWLVARLVLRR